MTIKMKQHKLKSVNPFFEAVWNRKKKFEFRKNDRNYEIGDYVCLKEYDAEKEQYLGREILMVITYIMHDHEGKIDGEYCIFSFNIIQRYNSIPKWETKMTINPYYQSDGITIYCGDCQAACSKAARVLMKGTKMTTNRENLEKTIAGWSKETRAELSSEDRSMANVLADALDNENITPGYVYAVPGGGVVFGWGEEDLLEIEQGFDDYCNRVWELYYDHELFEFTDPSEIARKASELLRGFN